VGVIFLMLTRRYRPYPVSIVRVWLWSEFYFVVTLIVDELTGVNYGFLLHKPEAFFHLKFSIRLAPAVPSAIATGSRCSSFWCSMRHLPLWILQEENH